MIFTLTENILEFWKEKKIGIGLVILAVYYFLAYRVLRLIGNFFFFRKYPIRRNFVKICEDLFWLFSILWGQKDTNYRKRKFPIRRNPIKSSVGKRGGKPEVSY